MANLGTVGFRGPVAAVASGSSVALLDDHGRLVLVDIFDGDTRVLSRIADTQASPAVRRADRSLYWIEFENQGPSPYRLAALTPGSDQVVRQPFPDHMTGLGITSFDDQRVLVAESLDGTGAPRSKLVTDNLTDGTPEDQTRLNLGRPQDFVFENPYYNPKTKELLLIVFDDTLSKEELWLVELS